MPESLDGEAALDDFNRSLARKALLLSGHVFEAGGYDFFGYGV
ncbi:protein of unknown function [Candidatus Promineifilum breve]|uniref:Uncharacterized protein n=1 Tax=Candidatus Promineifilum breve TaxID=1806508 RepID=A0A160T5X6_9CHLR|nr:hypothetical protein [Candidatus Promineifilum breve]CUS05374.2 protein of unknown function [Candidatus Promineifilum breve]